MKNKQQVLKSLFSILMGVIAIGGLLHANQMVADTQQPPSKMTGESPSVQIKPDGTKIIKEQDGTLIQVNPDGSKLIQNPDGSKVIKKPATRPAQ